MDLKSLKKASELTHLTKWNLTPEQLTELAINGLCPHRVLINPVTNERIIYFISAEVYDWLNTNYFVNASGVPLKPNYNFFYFHNESKIKSGDNIPVELINIQNLYRLPLAEITTPAGVYFLCRQNQIVYVGQAVNVATRIITHIGEGFKKFDTVYYIPCTKETLNDLETACIKHFKPEYNNRISDIQSEVHKSILENVINKIA